MTRATREQVKSFYDNWCHPTVAERLAWIDAEAADRAALIESSATKERADIQRWACDQLNACVLFQEPPPSNLVRLIKLLIGVSEKPRAKVRNRKKWLEAVNYVARNPKASASQIRKAIGYDQLTQIKKWLGPPDFKKRVETERLILKAIRMKQGRQKPFATPPASGGYLSVTSEFVR